MRVQLRHGCKHGVTWRPRRQQSLRVFRLLLCRTGEVLAFCIFYVGKAIRASLRFPETNLPTTDDLNGRISERTERATHTEGHSPTPSVARLQISGSPALQEARREPPRHSCRHQGTVVDDRHAHACAAIVRVR